jgi:hypothetical protein
VVVSSPLGHFDIVQWPPESAMVARLMFHVGKKSKNEDEVDRCPRTLTPGGGALYVQCSKSFYSIPRLGQTQFCLSGLNSKYSNYQNT